MENMTPLWGGTTAQQQALFTARHKAKSHLNGLLTKGRRREQEILARPLGYPMRNEHLIVLRILLNMFEKVLHEMRAELGTLPPTVEMARRTAEYEGWASIHPT